MDTILELIESLKPLTESVIERNPIPHFYIENREKIDTVFNSLSDRSSKEIYAREIKSIQSGDTAYLRRSNHPPYQHPAVVVNTGDIVIQAGVYAVPNEVRYYSKLVGDEGKIYGFEPIKHLHAAACAALSKSSKNIELINAGLGIKTCQCEFEINDTASRKQNEVKRHWLKISKHDFKRWVGIGKKPATSVKTEICSLIDIDSFMASRDRRVNIIQLDVEGAELDVLVGARKTITQFTPTLIVCLYHNPNDVIDIPLYINSLGIGYQFYVSHHGPHYYETILYAIPLNRLPV